ncbi:hypothetical protein [Corallococcus carmarthensis]|uniref:hypothetical protein n=1 Tax=Corallococcus carmarthensis TaxID=2316728 RepID=UPI00148E7E9B|nr:hypothetical protein [Corallococcus carmarthensis]NOK15836.1 hypothetical protein [Corallococcus carmarthensis]
MKSAFEAVLVLAAITVLGGCGGTPESVEEFDVELSKSSLSFTGLVVNDAGTQCTVNGSTMHCCPVGYAMIGAHVTNNVFKCAQLSSTSGARYLDTGTSRNGMHACPYGSVMVGMNTSKNHLACQAPGTAVVSEYVDGNPATTDSYPMHVCGAGGYAMSGINVGSNLYTCAR